MGTDGVMREGPAQGRFPADDGFLASPGVCFQDFPFLVKGSENEPVSTVWGMNL